MTEQGRELTKEDLCDLFDVTNRTITNWVKRGCPCDKSGKAHLFNGDEVAGWLKSNNLTGSVGKPSELTGPIGEQIKHATLRKVLAMAEKHEIDLLERKKLLVESATVEADNIQKFTLIRNKLMAIPAAAAFLVGKAPVEIERELETRIKEVLSELSRS